MAEPESISVVVAEDLDLDVTRMLEEFSHVELGRAEGLSRFLAGQRDGFMQLPRIGNDAHAATTTTASGLYDDGVSDLTGGAFDHIPVFRKGPCPARARRERRLRSSPALRQSCHPLLRWPRPVVQ